MTTTPHTTVKFAGTLRSGYGEWIVIFTNTPILDGARHAAGTLHDGHTVVATCHSGDDFFIDRIDITGRVDEAGNALADLPNLTVDDASEDALRAECMAAIDAEDFS